MKKTKKKTKKNALSCSVHKTYKAIFPPQATLKNPHGCAACWQTYHNIMFVRLESLQKDIDILGSELHALIWGPM